MNQIKLTVFLLALSVGYISCFELNSVTIEQFSNTTGWFAFNNSTATYNGTNVMRLDLSLKGISSINANAFERYKENIVYLRLYGNKLTKISPDAFVGMKNLVTVEFTYNQITEFSLPYLPNLEYLSADLNQISRFDMKVSELFPKLTNLNFGYNQLTYILPNAFHNANSLKVLRLPSNGFKTIDVNLFQKMPGLTQLYLERNLFTTVTTPFKLLPNLEYLELSQNQITDISSTAFLGIPFLKSLSIHGNKLATLRTDLFENTQLISFVLVSNNLLTTIPKGIFDDLPNLKQVYFASNNIQSLDKDLLQLNSDIRHIDLQGNKFTTVPKGLFQKKPNLEIINLSSNMLASVDYNDFAGLANLRYLYFRQNPLKVPVDTDAIMKVTNAKLTIYL